MVKARAAYQDFLTLWKDAEPDLFILKQAIRLNNLSYLLTLDGIIASRGGIPLIEQGKIIGAIGCSGGTDSQDEVVCRVAAAVIK